VRALVALALACACACGSHPASSTTTLAVTVTDGGVPVAARVLLFDAAGAPMHIGAIDMYGQRQSAAACVFAPGVVGTWDGLVLAYGKAQIPIGIDACTPSPAIPYGRYKVWAWRGLEYERWEGEVDLGANRGTVVLAIALERAWQPKGAVAADTHTPRTSRRCPMSSAWPHRPRPGSRSSACRITTRTATRPLRFTSSASTA
jgi:hypothetical protein